MKAELFYLENAEPETADSILCLLDMYGPEINNVTSSRTGIDAWFKGFITSKYFDRLSEEEKEQSFDMFQSMKFLLEELNSKVDENLIRRERSGRA